MAKEALALFQERIKDFTDKVTPTERLDVLKEDPTDDRILECAVAGKSEYLVTRDNHLLKLKNFGPTKIVKVAEFLEMVRNEGLRR